MNNFYFSFAQIVIYMEFFMDLFFFKRWNLNYLLPWFVVLGEKYFVYPVKTWKLKLKSCWLRCADLNAETES